MITMMTLFLAIKYAVQFTINELQLRLEILQLMSYKLQIDGSLTSAIEHLRIRKEIATLTPQYSREINNWYQGMKTKMGKTLASLQVLCGCFSIINCSCNRVMLVVVKLTHYTLHSCFWSVLY